MRWPDPEEICAMWSLPEGYGNESLKRADIPALIAAIKVWHPDVAVGAASCYLREDFYTEKVSLAGETERDVIVVVTRFNDELAGMGSWEREPDARTLYARFGAIAPEHRGAKLAVRAMEFGERLGRAMGAGFIYGMATLKIPNMQLALERAGYQLLGFTPGYDREVVAPGIVKRVYEAVYAKVLVTDEELLRPDPKNLSPKAKALFDVLFPA
jgi:GNAT superfamily N-acetyltransferase